MAGSSRSSSGPPSTPEPSLNSSRPWSVSVDGETRAGAAVGDDTTDPATALADLVAMARERGMTLPKDSVISTGSASKPFNLAAPGRPRSPRGSWAEAVGFRTVGP